MHTLRSRCRCKYNVQREWSATMGSWTVNDREDRSNVRQFFVVKFSFACANDWLRAAPYNPVSATVHHCARCLQPVREMVFIFFFCKNFVAIFVWVFLCEKKMCSGFGTLEVFGTVCFRVAPPHPHQPPPTPQEKKRVVSCLFHSSEHEWGGFLSGKLQIVVVVSFWTASHILILIKFSFVQGTSHDQDSRFANKHEKLKKSLKFPPEYEQKVSEWVYCCVACRWCLWKSAVWAEARVLSTFNGSDFISFVYASCVISTVLISSR